MPLAPGRQYTTRPRNKARIAVSLNPQQRAAVLHVDTPLLVIAGAGSGKTGVITQKIAHMVEQLQYAPRSIVAVTFTNKAALEMRERLKKQLGGKIVQQLSISTFHRLGLDMLRKHGEAIGLRRGFTIFDQHDSLVALRDILREGNSALEERVAQQLISGWKNAFVEPVDAVQLATTEQERIAAHLYARYNEFLRACNACDFDDLISLPVALLQQQAAVREAWQGRLRHLLIDEYQDTNAAQYALVRLLVDRFGAFTAVGDDDQSIYSWRGARPENLTSLKEDYPNLRVIALEQNYRSTQRILRCANAVISKNPHTFEKKLWSDLGIGEELRLSVCRHGIDEAEWVASEILMQHHQKGRRFGDFAILYRSNFQSRPFEQALRERQIPYAISGGSSFLDRAEIKDMMAYLRLLVNPDDDTAFLRCINTPRREIGPTTLAKLGQYAQSRRISLFNACHEFGLDTVLSGKTLARLRQFANWMTLMADNAERGDTVGVVRQVFDDIDYRDWIGKQAETPAQAERSLQNVAEMIGWIERISVDADNNERSLVEIVNQIALQDMLERNDDDAGTNQVQMMTLHAAKGLEFPHVFMVGMEEDILPHRNSIESDDIEEERRLAYVGMTRARHTLTLTRTRARQRHGDTSRSEASRFIDDIPGDDIVIIGEPGDSSPEQARTAGKAALAGLMSMLSDD